ncbi:MAG: phosphate transport system regulatory protein PhoU [Pseudomonadota bacterium]|jgi:phosphate transport system protein
MSTFETRKGSHISEQFDHDLRLVSSHMMEMGGLVEEQVASAINALINVDAEAARQVIERDVIINRMETSVDNECTNIIARRQPAASDLRLVISISKAVADLERIGDEAKRIAKMAVSLSEGGGTTQGFVEVRHIGQMVRHMVHESLDAFVRMDTEDAAALATRDIEVDREYASAMREMMTYMMEDPRMISRAMNVIWALRSLERIGDHALNIAEQVVYTVSGKDVRHAPLA